MHAHLSCGTANNNRRPRASTSSLPSAPLTVTFCQRRWQLPSVSAADYVLGVSAANDPKFEPLTIEALYPPARANIDANKELGWLRRLWPLLRAHKFVIAGALVTGLLGVALNVSVPLLIRDAIDTALASDPSARSRPLTHYVAALLAIAASLLLLRSLYRSLLFRAAHQVDTDLRELIYSHLTRLSFSFFDTTASGEVISRANSDIRSVQILLAFAPLAALSIVSFVIALVLMLRIHVLLTLVALVPMPFVYYVAQHMRNQVFPLSWITSSRQAEVATVVDENIGGIRVVKSFAAEYQQIAKLASAAQRLQWSAVAANDSRARHNPVIEALPQLGSALVLLYGGVLAIDGTVTVGTILAFNAYVILISLPFRLFGFLLMQSQRAAAAAQRIFAILDKDIEIDDKPGAIDLHNPGGEIVFENVSFSYGGVQPTPSDDEPASTKNEPEQGRPKVLDGLSFRIEAGETVALVGRTGSGKSTITRLIPRFYDPSAGRVLLDNHDVRDLTMRSVRHHVNVVLDEPFLFSISLRDNIAFARPDASDADVESAAIAAHAHEFIIELPGGYETVVGERGYTLSGGQRQRIAIARTLLANPKVLVLDDATSAIDVQVEEKIHDALRALMTGRTTVIVAHRLSTISLADRVVLLEGGQIIADGTHAKLMATEPKYVEVLATADIPEATEGNGRTGPSADQ